MKEFTGHYLLQNVLKGKFDDFRAYINENNITHLNLSGRVKKGSLKLWGEALKGTQVTYVDLSENNFGMQGVKDLTEFLKGTKIINVDLSVNEIGAQGVKDLGEVLKGTLVTHIDLGYNEIGTQGVKGLGEALKDTQITHVKLRGNKIDAQGVKDLGEVLKGTLVTHIVLDHNEIGTQGAKDLGEALKGTLVTDIDLHLNGIDAQGAKDFGESLKDTKLTHVNLSWNTIGDQGAKDFCEALKGTQITHVKLNGNKIGAQGAKDLGEALKGSQVTHIELVANEFGEKGAEDFVGCIPDTLLLKVHIFKTLGKYILEAVQSNVAKYIYTPYYLIALKLLPEEEKDKCKNIKKEELGTRRGQLRYACGILLHPRLPQDIFDHIYRFLPLASKKENIISTYLGWAKYYRLRNAFEELSLNTPYQPQQNKYILNQYRLQPKTDLPAQPVFAQRLNERWKKNLLL